MNHQKIVSRKRHLVKTITWRVLATTVTFLLTWAATGKLAIGATVGGLEASSKMVLYYLHERAWYHFDFGITEAAEAEEAKAAGV